MAYEVMVGAVNFVDGRDLPIMKSACDESGMVAHQLGDLTSSTRRFVLPRNQSR